MIQPMGSSLQRITALNTWISKISFCFPARHYLDVNKIWRKELSIWRQNWAIKLKQRLRSFLPSLSNWNAFLMLFLFWYVKLLQATIHHIGNKRNSPNGSHGLNQTRKLQVFCHRFTMIYPSKIRVNSKQTIHFKIKHHEFKIKFLKLSTRWVSRNTSIETLKVVQYKDSMLQSSETMHCEIHF